MTMSHPDDFDIPDWEDSHAILAPGYWRTKEGILLRIRDMADDHLLNTIRMLERQGQDVHSCTPLCYLDGEREVRKLDKKPL